MTNHHSVDLKVGGNPVEKNKPKKKQTRETVGHWKFIAQETSALTSHRLLGIEDENWNNLHFTRSFFQL